MEFSGVAVSLDVATGLGLVGAFLGWFLRKRHEDKMAEREKSALTQANAKAAKDRNDALVIQSLEPLNQSIQTLHSELEKAQPNLATSQKLLAEIEDLYIRITISAAYVASTDLYKLIVDGVEGHRNAVKKKDLKLVVINGVVLFADLLQKVGDKASAERAVEVLYGTSVDRYKEMHSQALKAERV